MVQRIKKIEEEYVDYGSYFVLNRGRQYGKTTTLKALAKYLSEEYIVFSLDFQQMGTKTFEDEISFTRGFLDRMLAVFKNVETDDKEKIKEMLLEFKEGNQGILLDGLFAFLSDMCENSPRPIVLMIDEVDSASNNQVFIDFLAQLRGYYLKRDDTLTFYSMILAGG